MSKHQSLTTQPQPHGDTNHMLKEATTFECDAILMVDDHHGVYQAQYFAECILKDCVSGVTDDEWNQLAKGPDEEYHWDLWTQIESNATITNPDTGIKYFIYHNGPIWLVPEGCEIPEF